MERQVKIELPKKYVVGIEAMFAIRDNAVLEACKRIVATIAQICNGDCSPVHVSEQLEKNGRVIVSSPLIRSIAEIKTEGLNNAFGACGAPFKAFLKQEDD